MLRTFFSQSVIVPTDAQMEELSEEDQELLSESHPEIQPEAELHSMMLAYSKIIFILEKIYG
jgi:hypothetical protein